MRARSNTVQLQRSAWPLLTLLVLVAALLCLACAGAAGDDDTSGPSKLATAIGEDRPLPEAALAVAREPAPPPQPLPLPWAAAPQLKDGAPQGPEVTAAAAVVLDEASGAVLYDKDAHAGLAPASLTKIATLVLALEQGDPDAWVQTDVDFTQMRGSTVMGLLPGDVFTLRDLLYGLMLPSGNDAAVAIGRHLAGSDAAFVARLNALLQRLGLRDSRFSNPHGLGSGEHYSSPYDLAMLSRYGMSLPGFFEIVNAPAWSAHGSRELSYANINSFLYSYRGADGVKTGYTRRAGQTLVASATRNGHRLYAVVLNAPARDLDATRLLNWAFASYVWPQ